MDLIRERTLKARRPHRCGLCPTIIAKGETYYRNTYADAGQLYDTKTCVPCVQAIVEAWLYNEGMATWADENRSTEAARDYLARQFQNRQSS
jgi:hypothetical protein